MLNTTSPESIPVIQRILEERYSTLSDAERQHQANLLFNMLKDRIIDAAIDALPDDQLEACEYLFNRQPTAEQIFQFFSQHLPNLPALVDWAAEQFYQQQTS